MSCKKFFRDEPIENLSEIAALRVKYNWSPPKGQSAPEMFLRQMEEEIFSLLPGHFTSYKLTKKE